MLFNAIHWNANPTMLDLGFTEIRWYGLLFASGFLIGYMIFTKMSRKENVPDQIRDDLLMYMLLATVVGARLGHCLFYEPAYYLSNPIEILKVWKGGLASHGGAIGILVALTLFSKKYKIPFFWVIDRITVCTALAGSFIRFGNLMNSEIYGVQTDLPWGMIFQRTGESLPKHPTQIYEALSYLAIFLFLIAAYYKHNGKPRQGYLSGMFLFLVFSARFIIEFIKEPQVGFEEHMLLNMGQWLSLPFIILGLLSVFFGGKLPHKELPDLSHLEVNQTKK